MGDSGDVCGVEVHVEDECWAGALHGSKHCCCRHSVAGGLRGAEAQAQTLIEQRGEVQEVGARPVEAAQRAAEGGAAMAVPGGGGRGAVDGKRRLYPLDGAASPLRHSINFTIATTNTTTTTIITSSSSSPSSSSLSL